MWRIPCEAADCVTWWCKWELGWSYNIIHIDFVTWWCKRDQMGWSYLWCYHEYRSRSLGGDGKKQENKNAATSMYLNFWALHARAKFVTKRLQLAHSCTSGLLVVSQSCNDDWFKTWQVEDSSTKLWRFNDNLDWWQIKANAACLLLPPPLFLFFFLGFPLLTTPSYSLFYLSSFNSPPPKTQTKTKKTKKNNNNTTIAAITTATTTILFQI